MRKILFIVIAITISFSLLYSENANEGGEVYIIQSGDTLWDLAQQFYHNPWLWPRLWEANPYIENPHLIYPGKPLAVPKILSGPPPTQSVAAAPTGVTTASNTGNTMLPRPATGVTVPPPVEPAQQTGQQEMAAAQPTGVAKPLNGGEELPPAPPSMQTQAQTMPEATATMPMEEEEPTIQTIVIPQPPPIHYFIRIGSEGFISRYELKSYGRIVGSDLEKVLYSQGDYLYINMGESAGTIRGDKFVVFEMQDPVYSPRYQKDIGYQVRVKGFLKVVDVYKDTSKVLVTQSFDAIMIGDSIKPFEPFPKHIRIKKAEANANGYVIGTIDEREAVGEGDIIYMDIGKKDGVEIGNVVEIYRPARKVYDPVKKKEELIPPMMVGKAVVLGTQEYTSVGLIFKSYFEIYRKYGVRLVAEY